MGQNAFEPVSLFQKRPNKSKESFKIIDIHTGKTLNITCTVNDLNKIVLASEVYGIVSFSDKFSKSLGIKSNKPYYWAVPIEVCNKFFDYSCDEIDISNDGVVNGYF